MVYVANIAGNVTDETTFSALSNRLVKGIAAAEEGVGKLELRLELARLKFDYFTHMAESLDGWKQELADSYRKDAHVAFLRIMDIYGQLPDDEAPATDKN